MRGPSDAYFRASRRCVLGLYASVGLYGAIQVVVPNSGALYLMFVVVFAAFVTCWAVFDAKSQKIAFLPVLQMLCFIAWPIGAVVYLVYRSGAWGIGIATIHGLGLLAALIVSFYITIFSLHYAGMLDPSYYQ